MLEVCGIKNGLNDKIVRRKNTFSKTVDGFANNNNNVIIYLMVITGQRHVWWRYLSICPPITLTRYVMMAKTTL